LLLRINEYEEDGSNNEQSNQEKNTRLNDIDNGLLIGSKSTDLVSPGIHLTIQKTLALFYKKSIHTIRNKLLTFLQLTTPIFFMLIMIIFLKYGQTDETNSPSLKIDLNQYGYNYAPYQLIPFDSEFLRMFSSSYETLLNEYSNTNAFDLNFNQQVAFKQCMNAKNSIDDYLACVGESNIVYLTDNNVVAATFDLSHSYLKAKITGHFNNQPHHTQPLTLNLITNSLFRVYSNLTEAKITVINHPLPRTEYDIVHSFRLYDFTGFFLASALTSGFGFFVACFVVPIIKENVNSSKHIQILSGCSSIMYWTCNFVWDLAVFLVTSFVIIVMIWVKYKI
jgi:ATP-binding cassette subfamily A (ABC1) protein 3